MSFKHPPSPHSKKMGAQLSCAPLRAVSRAAGIILAVFVAVSPVAAHHGTEPVFSSPQAPAAGATSVSVAGTVQELIVDNRVSGAITRYVSLRLDDGSVVALRGTGLDALAAGQRAEATGAVAGTTLFASSARAVGGVRASPDANAQGTTSVGGKLAVAHADYFDQGRGEYLVHVLSGDGKATTLLLSVMPDALQIGMSVIAQGTLSADGASLQTNRITVTALPANDPVQAPVTNKVLVILIKFTNSPAADPFTPAAVDQVMRTSSGSVANYYSEVSYGQQLLDVTVTNWLPANAPTNTSCDFSVIGNLANTAATAAGFNLASYVNKFYVMPYNPACGWAGLAYIGFPYLAWSNGYNQLGVYGHELGHNFTLYHAGSVACAGQVIGGSCNVAEYGDPFDVMGNISGMHFNAMQKSHLNWIPATSVMTHASGNAVYTLSPIESAGQSTYAVKIPASANRTYWIEYRQPIGFDAGMTSFPNNGAQIRVATPLEFTGGADDTEIVDTTLGTPGNFNDAALLVGQTYTDSTYGISVHVVSATPSALTLSVSSAGAAQTTTSLASSLNPSTVGTSVTFTATVAGVAPTGSVSFADGGNTIAGCSASALTGVGNSRTAICTTTSIPWGSRSIVAVYSGDGSNAPSTSPGLSQVVNAAGGTNVALASTGAIASASSTYSASLPVSSINNNERAGTNWGQGSGGWADGTPNAYPDWVQINFNGTKTIDHVVVYTVQDNFASPVEPTDTMTFSLYGVTNFSVQGWNGSAWVTLGTVAGNNLVKRTVTFAAYTTDRIRINITGAMNSSSRITEVEAWGVSAGPSNVALSVLGAVASASTTFNASHPVAAINNNERAGTGWGNGGGWADGTPNAYPDWVQINFNGTKTIDHAVVYTVQDNFASPVEPTDTQTFSLYGVTAFNVQGWNGNVWVTLGTVAGNNLVKRTVSFAAFTTDRIRVNVTNAMASSSRITEVEAWGN
jgi:hypothetical protein